MTQRFLNQIASTFDKARLTDGGVDLDAFVPDGLGHEIREHYGNKIHADLNADGTRAVGTQFQEQAWATQFVFLEFSLANETIFDERADDAGDRDCDSSQCNLKCPRESGALSRRQSRMIAVFSRRTSI